MGYQGRSPHKLGDFGGRSSPTTSLIPQRHSRIHAGRAARGQIAGPQRDSGQQRGDRRQRGQIRGAHFEQQGGQKPGQRQRGPRPAARPAPASTAACRSTIASTSRRSAPNAMRMPISRVRDVTAQETTP